MVLLEARVNQRHRGPERRPGVAGLRGGRTHTGGDALAPPPVDRFSRLEQTPKGAHGLRPCALRATSAVPKETAEAGLPLVTTLATGPRSRRPFRGWRSL